MQFTLTLAAFADDTRRKSFLHPKSSCKIKYCVGTLLKYSGRAWVNERLEQGWTRPRQA